MTKRLFAWCAMLALLPACESDSEVEQAAIQWLEWPAEVHAATPFAARAITIAPVCYPHQFQPRVTANDSAVTVAPFFLVERNAEPICPPTAASLSPLPVIALDTTVMVPGLATSTARTFDMLATTPPDPAANTLPGLPVRVFGEVSVLPGDPDPSRRNAGGFAGLRVDEQGCARIRPARQFNPGLEYVLEDQADTSGLSSAFVRGYIHDATAPVCGATRVFHLQSKN